MDDDIALGEWDFGFSSHTEEELLAVPSKELNEITNRLNKLHQAILPLLDNLMKDSDTNPYIHWPNRKEKINQFKQTIEKIVKGE